MDSYLIRKEGTEQMELDTMPERKRELARWSMGYALRFAERMDLVKMRPMGELASSGYCLANPGQEYLVYLPDGGSVRVDLSGAAGGFGAEWFNPTTGKTESRTTVAGGGKVELTAPSGGDAVLYVRKEG